MIKKLFTWIIVFILFITSVYGLCSNARNTAVSLGAGGTPYRLSFGDYDADGFVDIAVTDSGNDEIFLYYNNGYGSFSNFTTLDVGLITPTHTTSGIFTEDGRYDAVFSDGIGIYIYNNNGDKTYTKSTVALDVPTSLSSGDFDGDGDRDIVYTIGSNIKIIKNVADSGIFVGTTTIPMTTNLADIFVGDIDSDNDLDAVACSNAGDVNWYENDGAMGFQERILSELRDCKDIIVTDLNSDGYMDIVAVSGTDNTTVWYKNGGIEIFEVINISDETGRDIFDGPITDIASSDYDDDGDVDIFVVIAGPAGDDDVATVFTNDGDETFTRHNFSITEPITVFVAVEDFNDDGFGDMIVSEPTPTDIIWWNSLKCEDIAPQQVTSPVCRTSEHIMFCDDFDYDFPFTYRGWTINFDGYIDNITATPVNESMYFVEPRLSAKHSMSILPVSYQVDERTQIVNDYRHPVVSHSFNFNLTSNLTEIFYTVYDDSFRPSVDISFKDNRTLAYNVSTNTYDVICDDCIISNETHNVYIAQYFGQDTISIYGIQHLVGDYFSGFFPFNTSVDVSYYDVWLNGVQIGDGIPFRTNESRSVRVIDLVKLQSQDDERGMWFDDIYIYRGTSIVEDNSDDYFMELIEIYPTNQTSIYGDLNESERDSDLAINLEEGLKDMGIITLTSRILFAIVTMIVSIIIIASQLGKVGVDGGGIMVISFAVIFLEIFYFVKIGFIPVWVVFLMFLLGSGIVFFAIKNMSGGGD